MKRLIAILVLLAVNSTAHAVAFTTVYVDNTAVKYVSTWATGNIPAQPTLICRMGDGTSQDLANYGSNSPIIATPLTNGSAGATPAQAEGPLSKNQSANYFVTDDFLWINSGTVLHPTTLTSMSFAIWVRPVAFASSMALLGKRSSVQIGAAGGRTGYVMGIATTGKPYFLCCDDADQASKTSSVTLLAGTWNLIGATLTFDPLGNTSVTISVNGAASESSGAIAGVDSISKATQKFIIGSINNGAASPLNGDVAWVGVWDGTAVSDANWAAMYAAMTPTGTSLNPYPSIQAAVYQSNNIGNVVVSIPVGVYRESIAVPNDSLTITGANTTYPNRPLIYGGSLITGSTGFDVTAMTTIKYLRISGFYNGRGIRSDSTSDGSVYHHNEVDSCAGAFSFIGSVNDTIWNCTIYGDLAADTGIVCRSGSAGTVGTVVCYNTIFSDLSIGIDTTLVNTTFTVTRDYCDRWNVTATEIAAGSHDISKSPLFYKASSDNFQPTNVALMHAGLSWYGESEPIQIGAWEVISVGGGSGWGSTWPAGFRRPNWKAGF